MFRKLSKPSDTEARSAGKRAVTRGGFITAEYVLLVTIVGIGVIVGLAALRCALIEELHDLAKAVCSLIC